MRPVWPGAVRWSTAGAALNPPDARPVLRRDSVAVRLAKDTSGTGAQFQCAVILMAARAVHGRALAALGRRAAQRLTEFDAQGVANLAWALSTLRSPCEPLLQQTLTQSHSHL
eukprot:g23904.t1